mmetsp:Transcript_11697/g.28387  ORF Transcript_11697/g.28387 Transcript_11697/m.28387 type:complete len:81 (+) Transcript_11697:24-266(+)
MEQIKSGKKLRSVQAVAIAAMDANGRKKSNQGGSEPESNPSNGMTLSTMGGLRAALGRIAKAAGAQDEKNNSGSEWSDDD